VKYLFPNPVNQLSLEERKAHAELMVIIASIDGELVQEELAIIESLMGISMLHPEMRVDIRNMLSHPSNFEEVVGSLSKQGLKIALRDGALVAAVDGNYDKKELRILKSLAKLADVDNKTLSELFEWVEETWTQYKNINNILSIL
jgi:tellurite resistance protein